MNLGRACRLARCCSTTQILRALGVQHVKLAHLACPRASQTVCTFSTCRTHPSFVPFAPSQLPALLPNRRNSLKSPMSSYRVHRACLHTERVQPECSLQRSSLRTLRHCFCPPTAGVYVYVVIAAGTIAIVTDLEVLVARIAEIVQLPFLGHWQCMRFRSS